MPQVCIGIDENTSLLYEGSPSIYGHAIWPTPFLSLASHIGPLHQWQRAEGFVDLRTANMLFREDYFDPVARVRRGRLYCRYAGRNPADWHVQRHPAFGAHPRSEASYSTYGHSPGGTDGYSPACLLTFTSWVAGESVLARPQDSVLVLGDAARPSICRGLICPDTSIGGKSTP